MATQLKIATLNCAGMVNDIRRATLYDVCKKLSADIILLQETHSITTDEPKWHNKWTPLESAFNSAKDNLHRQNGVAILVNKTHLTLKNTKCDENGRILAATIFHDKIAIVNIINVYAPTASYSSQVRNDFFNSLYKFFDWTKPNIIAGDFNMVMNPALDRQPPTITKECPQSFKELCETFNLKDSYRLLYNNLKTFSRRQGHRQSRLDRFYIDQLITPKQEFNIPIAISDHDVVILQLETKNLLKPGKGTWKNNASIYSDEHFCNYLLSKWQLWQTLYPTIYQNKVTWWLDMKTRIKDLNIEFSKYRVLKSITRKRVGTKF